MYIPVELRDFVAARANGRCEYCQLPQEFSFFAHEIDHVVALKHGGMTVDSNLALACILCNKHKGTDLTSIDPQTGAIEKLFNPRQDIWADHFRLEFGRIEPLTPTGRVTERLLQFNIAPRIEERRIRKPSSE